MHQVRVNAARDRSVKCENLRRQACRASDVHINVLLSDVGTTAQCIRHGA